MKMASTRGTTKSRPGSAARESTSNFATTLTAQMAALQTAQEALRTGRLAMLGLATATCVIKTTQLAKSLSPLHQIAIMQQTVQDK
jgi:hypothetical protein